MYYIYIPYEMRQQMHLDASIIDLFQQGRSDIYRATGRWETFQGELYIME